MNRMMTALDFRGLSSAPHFLSQVPHGRAGLLTSAPIEPALSAQAGHFAPEEHFSLEPLRAAADSTADELQSGADAAVAVAVDFVSPLLGIVVGLVLGFFAAALMSWLLRRTMRRWAVGAVLTKRIRTPLYVSGMVWLAWMGVQWPFFNSDEDSTNATVVATAAHALLILAIAAMTWIAYSAAWVFEDAARLRQGADQGRARRFETQAQVIRRLIQVIVVIVGIVSVLGTFAAARQVMTTLLASAGLISVIAGLAAQQTLGNVFAGVLLAFTDAIRVGDVVVANQKGESGAIEEITLSYVVVRLWDERRLIVPSTYFTSNSFENWTRRAAAQLGTVELQLDWAAPMALLRQKVEAILASTDLWDGRTWNVQMTASDMSTVTVRVLVSAQNSGNLSDLRCYIREHLIDWIVSEEPWLRPASRIQPQESITVEVDPTRARVATLASELASIAGDPTQTASHEGAASALASGPGLADQDEAIHAARMVAARRKAKRARRRAMSDRMRELAEKGDTDVTATSQMPSSARTQVMTQGTLARILATPKSAVSGGERLYSGSPDAEERSGIFAGPGEEALAEREAVAKRREAEARGREHS